MANADKTRGSSKNGHISKSGVKMRLPQPRPGGLHHGHNRSGGSIFAG